MTDLPESENDQLEELRERAESFESTDSTDGAPSSPQTDWAYETLRNFTRMVVDEYEKLFMLDAKGGLGKTYNIKDVLTRTLGPEGEGAGEPQSKHRGWVYKAGHTTPLALFESLWMARHNDVLFLDDMSGLSNSDKCVQMLKAATDTEGEENWVTYESSRTPTLGPHETPVETFNFRGQIIISFNETPDNDDFRALEDRAAGSGAYTLDFDYDDRMRLIREIAKSDDISTLPYDVRNECVEWVETVSDPSLEPSIRTLESVLRIREYAEESNESVDWQKMALESFDLNYEKYLIWKMRTESEMPVSEQVDTFIDKTGRSQGYYYDLLSEMRQTRNES
jgi:hypothetical protein